MNKFKIFLFCSLVTIFSLINSNLIICLAQEKNSFFPENPSEYIEKLTDYMGVSLTEKETNIFANFLQAWKMDSLFSEDEQQRIIHSSQLLHAKNAKPRPHFVNYFNNILRLKKDPDNQSNYYPWEECLNFLLGQEETYSTTLNNFLVASINILSGEAVYKTSSTKWVSSNPRYSFMLEEKPIVRYDETNLICYAKRDSMELFNTTGIFDPVKHIWYGKGGLVTWERGGYGREDIFAVLDGYTIDMSRSDYKAENVSFTNNMVFETHLQGILIDKVKYNKQKENATYPRFDSYTQNFQIDNIYPEIDYEGGLSMQGAKLVGTGTKEKLAKLKIYREDSLLLMAHSAYFAFKSDRVVSNNTGIVIYMERDSIFHPSQSFSYKVPNRELTLSRNDNFTSQSPYYNSYHNIDMSVEQLNWNMNEPYMRFTPPLGSAIGNATFESSSFFNYDYYINLQGMDRAHPLISIRSFARRVGTNSFTATDYANYLRQPVSTVRQQLMRLSVMGFIFFDSDTETATLKQKLNDYIAAAVGKIDYDVISFPSSVNAPLENAVFNLKTFDLTVNGIPSIQVSDSQNVIIFPWRDRITMKRNRSFVFDGTVIAGLLSFYGQNFYFNYDSFSINLQNVDSMSIKYLSDTYSNYGFRIPLKVKNAIEHITGEILIDKSDNKSGRKYYSEYPIFKSKENSFVFYEKPEIQSGVYTQEDFYFEIFPFTMDSLDNFNREAMRFDGELISADIFPIFDQTLVLQKDNSLGFLHTLPPDGLPMYKGRGIFKNQVELTNQGFRGIGELEYLTSKTKSEEFWFYPDSTNAEATGFVIEEKTTPVEFPYVYTQNSYIHWLPYADQFFTYRSDNNFNMFNDTTYLTGNLLLEPTGLSGIGLMDLKNSTLRSKSFTYKAKEIFADTADFKLKSLKGEDFTVLTENVNAHINYTNQSGQFKSNEEFTLVDFPENRYVSFIDYFEWDMKNKNLAMGVSKTTAPDEDRKVTGPRYISVHPDQDSLNFVSPLAYYDYKENLLRATEVKYIDVADARVYPIDGKIIVEAGAKMRTLINAQIEANRFSKYHMFDSSSVQILSRNNYTGAGDYTYVDALEQEQTIYFSEIYVTDSIQTKAEGNIPSFQEFRLSPEYAYQGKVILDASRKFLTYKGSTLIEHNCDKLHPDWLLFNSVIDPENIYLPVPEQPLNINRNSIFSSIFIYYDSVHIYPAFLTGRKAYSDNPIVTADGYLFYDKNTAQYKIASMDKLQNRDLPGNYMSLHREDCQLYGEGKINLGQNLGQMKLTTVGNIRHDINNNNTKANVLMGINFFIADNVINIMATEIDSIPDIPASNLNSFLYKKGMEELVGPPMARKLYNELALFGDYKETPEELEFTLFLNKVTLLWNDESNSYISSGKIEIGSINNIQINKQVDGLIELQIKRSGDIFDMYIEIDKNTWYYFGYTRGVLQILSSNKAMLDEIISLKPKERKSKVKRGTSFIYLVSTDRKMKRFYDKYRRIIEEGEEVIENE